MAHNGARYTRTLTDQQAEAILKAHLVDGIRPSEIRRLAETGQLGVPAFELTTHVYTVIKRGREAFEDANSEALANGTENELKRLHKLALAKARHLKDTTDVAEIARTAKALRETERAMAQKPRPQAKAKPDAAAKDTLAAPASAGPSVVTGLLAMAGGRTGSLDHAKTGQDAA